MLLSYSWRALLFGRKMTFFNYRSRCFDIKSSRYLLPSTVFYLVIKSLNQRRICDLRNQCSVITCGLIPASPLCLLFLCREAARWNSSAWQEVVRRSTQGSSSRPCSVSWQWRDCCGWLPGDPQEAADVAEGGRQEPAQTPDWNQTKTAWLVSKDNQLTGNPET